MECVKENRFSFHTAVLMAKKWDFFYVVDNVCDHVYFFTKADSIFRRIA